MLNLNMKEGRSSYWLVLVLSLTVLASVAAEEVQKKQAWLGIKVEPIPSWMAEHFGLPYGQGVRIVQVEPKGPASKAGVVVNDVITHLDNRPVSNQESLVWLLKKKKPTQTVMIEFIQRGKGLAKKVKLVGKQLAAIKENSIEKPNKEMSIYANENKPEHKLYSDNLLKQRAQTNAHLVSQVRQVSGNFSQHFGQWMNSLTATFFANSAKKAVKNLDSFGVVKEGVNVIGRKLVKDEQGSIELSTKNNLKLIKITNTKGEIIYQGEYPLDPKDKSISDKVRKRAKLVEGHHFLDGIKQLLNSLAKPKVK